MTTTLKVLIQKYAVGKFLSNAHHHTTLVKARNQGYLYMQCFPFLHSKEGYDFWSNLLAKSERITAEDFDYMIENFPEYFI